MLTSRLGPDDPLVTLAGHFLGELEFFGRSAQLRGRSPSQGELVRRYCERREIPIRMLVALLEQDAGLRFSGADLPYRHDSATWPPGQPMAGNTADNPDLTPGDWLGSVFSNWKTTADSESPDVSEMHRTLRSALWVCASAGVLPALRYVTDLVYSGQVLDVRAAAWAVSRILIVSSRTSDPVELVGRLIESGVPDTARGWLVFGLGDDCWLEPGQTSAEARAGLESLVEYGWSLVEQARAAATLDDWLDAILAVHGSLMFVAEVIKLTLGDPPDEVAALLGQFEELFCDVPAMVACLEIGAQHGMGMPGVVDYERRLERHFRDAGDRTGQRFGRERLLLPPQIMQEIPAARWTTPSWRIGAPWVIAHMSSIDDPADAFRIPPEATLQTLIQAVSLSPDQPEAWDRLGQALTEFGRDPSAAIARRMNEFCRNRAERK